MSKPAFSSSLLPLWVRLGQGQHLAGIDVHSPLYLKDTVDPYNGGDIASLYPLIDSASAAGIQLIHLTPIHDTGDDLCPYRSIGLFSFNPVFLDIDKLPYSLELDQLKKARRLEVKTEIALNPDRIFYPALRAFKRKAAQLVYQQLSSSQTAKFEQFFNQVPKHTLVFAVFRVLWETFGHVWYQWPEHVKKLDVKAVITRYPRLLPNIKQVCYEQWLLDSQWREVARYADKRGVYLVFDKAIYPMPHSADVWAHRQLFHLHSDGSPEYLSGCDNPDDPFGRQIWEHAVYRFVEQPTGVMAFFIETIAHMQQFARVIRLDHTLALIWKYYLIDPKTMQGHHRPALGYKLLQTLRQTFPDVLFIAEDVGYVSPKEIDQPLARLGILSMRCPQWSNESKNTQVTSYPFACLATTSTHDSPDIHAQFQPWSPHKNLGYADLAAYHQALFASPAALASITYRELVHDTRRYNHPGQTHSDSWSLHSPVETSKWDWSYLHRLVEETHRSRTTPLLADPYHILAVQPTPAQSLCLMPIDTFSLQIAVATYPKDIEVYTNLPYTDLGGWGVLTTANRYMALSIWPHSTIWICTIELTLPTACPEGIYEVAMDVFFPHGERRAVCKYGKNIEISVGSVGGYSRFNQQTAAHKNIENINHDEVTTA